MFRSLKLILIFIDLFLGPRALPILGNIFQMMTPFKTLTYPFTHFSKEYGEIYRLKVPFDEIGRFLKHLYIN